MLRDRGFDPMTDRTRTLKLAYLGQKRPDAPQKADLLDSIFAVGSWDMKFAGHLVLFGVGSSPSFRAPPALSLNTHVP